MLEDINRVRHREVASGLGKALADMLYGRETMDYLGARLSSLEMAEMGIGASLEGGDHAWEPNKTVVVDESNTFLKSFPQSSR